MEARLSCWTWLCVVALASAVVGDVSAATVPKVVGLRTEYMQDPLGLDVRRPRLFWRLESDARGVVQSAYQVRVWSGEARSAGARSLVWDSGRVTSADSVQRE